MSETGQECSQLISAEQTQIPATQLISQPGSQDDSLFDFLDSQAISSMADSTPSQVSVRLVIVYANVVTFFPFLFYDFELAKREITFCSGIDFP